MSQTPGFILFGAPHLLTLALILLLCVWISRVAHHRGRVVWLGWTMAVLLIAQEGVKQYLYVGIDGIDWRHFLPLHLCRINAFLCAYMLVRRSYRAFEVAYFWAMGASLIAMLTPDITQAFPDPRYVMFFLSHGLTIMAVLYAIFAYGFRPRLRSLGITLVVTAVYALLVSGVNVLLDANYLFLCARPEGASVLDFAGPWPGYLFPLFGLVVVVCFLCYLPFVRVRTLRSP